MQLDIGVTSGMRLKQTTGLIEIAQESGLNHVWVGDDITLHHDVFAVAAIVMLKSPNMHVGIGITSPLIRNITTIARASVSLIEIDGDKRFRLGLGIGGLQDLAKLGIKVQNSEKTLREATTLLRKIWKGETLSLRNGSFILRNYYTKHRAPYLIPIFLGVRGPRLLKLAGETADGAVLSGPRTYLETAIRIVKDNVKKSPRPERDFRVVVWLPTIVTEKRSDLNLVKRTVAFVLADTPRTVLEMADLNYHESEKIKHVYQSKGIEKAAELVTETLIEEVAIHGNPRQMCQAFESFEGLGVQEVVFGPPYGSSPHLALTKLANTWRGHP